MATPQPSDDTPLLSKARLEVMMSGKRWGLLVGLLAVLLLTACSPLTDAAQPRVDPEVAWTLKGEHSIGQTFVSHHDGLNGVQVRLRSPQGIEIPPLTFSIGTDPLDGQELATGTVPPADDANSDWTSLAFPPLPDSHGRRFYLKVAWAAGEVTVPLGPASAYRDGAAYLDGEAQEAQLAFRLTCDLPAMALGILRRLVSGLPQALAAALLFLLPGLAVTTWLLPKGPTGTTSRLILSAGLSAALFPLLFLATDVIGGPRLGPVATWLLLAICAAAVLWRAWPLLRAGKWKERIKGRWSWPTACLGMVALLVFGVRLLVVGSLAAPMWGDSYQHALIGQLLVDHGGLFDSWEPYAPVDTFTIHHGFHAATASFHWITGVDITRSTLLVGQILNGLAALALYPLAVRLSGRRWAGVAAMAIAGLLAPMPMYYVNWGRYPQLIGQVVLPIAAWFLVDALEAPRREAGRLGLAAISAAGLFLCYYRIGFFYATFAVAWWLGHGLSHWRRDARRWLDSLVRVAIVGLIAGVLVLPQALKLSQGYLVEAMGQQTTQPANWEAILRDYRMWRNVGFYMPRSLLALAAAGMVWSVIRRRWTVVSVGLWAAMLASLTLTAILRLPGAGMVTNFAVLIAWYLPVALLGGWLVGDVAEWLIQQRARAALVTVLAGLLLVCAWGARQQMGVVDRDFEMVTHADRAAMTWVTDHVPPDALFLINAFAVYNDTSVVGGDGGWWLPLLAGRRTPVPPQYALLNERSSEPGFLQRVTQMVLDLQVTPVTTPEGQRVLCQNGITHVYVGQRQGLVGTKAVALVEATELADSPGFRLLYHQDRVWVFRFDRSVCQD